MKKLLCWVNFYVKTFQVFKNLEGLNLTENLIGVNLIENQNPHQ